MYLLDLNTSFAINGVISPNVLESMTTLDGQNSGAMFTDPLMTAFYRFHGNGAWNISTISSFNTTTQTWTNAPVSGGNFNTAYSSGRLCNYLK